MFLKNRREKEAWRYSLARLELLDLSIRYEREQHPIRKRYLAEEMATNYLLLAKTSEYGYTRRLRQRLQQAASTWTYCAQQLRFTWEKAQEEAWIQKKQSFFTTRRRPLPIAPI